MLDESLASLGVNYQQFLLIGIAVYGVISVFTTVLAILLLWGISAIEKRTDLLKRMIPRKVREKGVKKQSLWTIPLIIGTAASFVYMIVMG